MSDYVNKALLDASPYRKQKDEAAKLVGKWEKTGLLDGMNEDFQKSGMAQLLENQAKQLVSEVSTTSPSGLGTGSDEEWSGVALPLVRRVFGEIVAQDLVSVQPMNLPSGLVFYLDFKYGSSRTRYNETTTGVANQGEGNVTSLGGKTGKFTPNGATAPFGEGGLYGAGRYGYTAATGSATVTATSSGSATLADLNYDTELSASNAGNLYKITGTFSSTDADKLGVRGWMVSQSAAATLTGDAYPLMQFASITGDEGATGTLTLIVSASSAIAAGGTFDVDYIKGSVSDSTRGDFEDRGGDATADSLKIPEVNLQLNSRAIVAKTRKLKAIWTPELAQDLNAYHSVDAEAELTSMLSEYISMEIDLEILDMLMNDAVTVDYWSAKVGNVYDSAAGAFTTSVAGNAGDLAYTRQDWWATLIEKIHKVSNEIHRLTLRGGANFVVCGPKIATILESVPGYNVNTDGTNSKFAMGVQQVGSISNRFNVYKNPYISENVLLIGFRGQNFLETGAVYAPYVPLIMTPLVYDPSDFTPRKGVMTRYAKKIVRPEFYGKIYCSDLNLL